MGLLYPKSRPKALDKAERKRAEESLYARNRKLALARDSRHCRICGSGGYVETHHVERRSAFGPKRLLEKHDVANLLTVCADCHEQLTKHILRAVATTADGTNGPVQITKFCDEEQGYVVVRDAA